MRKRAVSLLVTSTSTIIRRGRCALDKCYAYSSGARRRESVTEQQATEQQASREAHLNTNGRKGNSSSVRTEKRHTGGRGKNRGVAYRTRRWILAVLVRYRQARASITPYNKFTGRYGTICDGGPTGSNIAPRQLTLKSDSSGTITSVMYALGTTFSAIRRFSIIPIQIASASPYLSAENRTARFVFTFEFFRQIRGVEIATVRPHLVANRESVTDRRNSRPQNSRRRAKSV